MERSCCYVLRSRSRQGPQSELCSPSTTALSVHLLTKSTREVSDSLDGSGKRGFPGADKLHSLTPKESSRRYHTCIQAEPL